MKYLNVAAALIINNDKVLLCQREEDDDFGLMWEFPGGMIEAAETPEEAVKREIKEETGLNIIPQRMIGIFSDTKDGLTIKVHLFECKIRSGEPLAIECRNIKFVKIKSTDNMDLAPVDKKIAFYLKNSY